MCSVMNVMYRKAKENIFKQKKVNEAYYVSKNKLCKNKE